MSRQSESQRRKAVCVSCSNYKPIKAKDMCQNCWHKVKRKTNPEFFLRTRYTEIKQRCTNPNNKRADIYNGRSFCTLAEFLDLFLHNSQFLNLFGKWNESGYDATKTPSVDRIDNKLGYTLDNIQFITHSENATKDQPKTAILVYDENDYFITEFESQCAASRKLKIPQSNIWKVLVGERKKAGGLKFRYK